jgi:hypothetical protein
MKVVGCQPYAPAAFTPRINLVLILIYGKGKLNFRETKEVSSVLNTLRNNVNELQNITWILFGCLQQNIYL